jgi:peroxiredoxin
MGKRFKKAVGQSMLEIGVKAPYFELEDQNGKTYKFSDYKWKM